MQAIAAVDRNWAIGNKGKLLVSIPNDHKMFRRITQGKTLIYGRKTLETFPMQHPLEGRRNIILSRNPSLEVKGAEVVHSVEELLEKTGLGGASDELSEKFSEPAGRETGAENERSDEGKTGRTGTENGGNSDNLMVIGGASVYRQLLPYCDTVYVTKIDYEYEADAFFPNLDRDPEWELADESDEMTYFDVPYTFSRYVRKKA